VCDVAIRNSGIFQLAFSLRAALAIVPSIPTLVYSVVSSLLEDRALCHLCLHCCFVQPGTSAAIAAHPSSLCLSTASFSLPSSCFVRLPARAVVSSLLLYRASCHLFVHCFAVRPGTSEAIAVQSLILCFFTASVSVLSSSFVHLRYWVSLQQKA
jgi:hypothetical protein